MRSSWSPPGKSDGTAKTVLLTNLAILVLGLGVDGFLVTDRMLQSKPAPRPEIEEGAH